MQTQPDTHVSVSDLRATLAREILGDASNLKGTDYHLLYVLWLLLRENAARVSFFAGNDLLAAPGPPASPTTDASLSVFAHVEAADDRDVWIQLKSTSSPWTRSALLAENLLSNFILNSYISQSRDRNWTIRLVTTSEIPKDAIQAFVKKPEDFPELNENLKGVVDRVMSHVGGVGLVPQPTAEGVRQRALAILLQIAAMSPIHRAVIAAEVHEKLVVSFVDQQVARDVEHQLVGALLQDTSLGTPTARQYDHAWMCAVTGHDFRRSSPLDESVTTTCDIQVAGQIPTTYASRDCATRTATVRLLDDFLQSSSTVFILSGRSGTGKSWALYDWAARILAGRIRLFTAGWRFSDRSTLQSHIADALRQFSSQTLTDSALFKKFTQPAGSHLAPPILIIDDLRPSIGRPDDFARGIARLVDDARRAGVKLVISCQADLHRSLRPFHDVSRAQVFRPEGRSLRGADTDQQLESYAISDFTDDELKDAIYRALQPGVAESVYSQMRDSLFAHLRHPYSLGALLSELAGCSDSDIPQILGSAVVSVLDKRVDAKLAHASRLSGLDTAELREVLGTLVDLLWQSRQYGMPRMTLRRKIDERFGELGTRAMDALHSCGILLSGPIVEFAEAPLGARLTARRLHATVGRAGDLASQLRWEVDHELTAQLIATANDPVELGASFIDRTEEWIPGVAEGLMLADPDDCRVVALFIAMARRERYGWSSADAFGRFSLRSRRAQKDLLKRFVSAHHDDRALSGRALWTVARLAPDQTVRAVRVFFRLASMRLKQLKHDTAKSKGLKTLRQQSARALGVLGSIDSHHAAELVLSFLPTLGPFVDDSNVPLGRDKLAFVCSDALVEKFDELESLASAHADELRFNRILAALESTDLATRAHAVNGLFYVSRNLPDAVGGNLLSRLAEEQSPLLLEKLLWSSYAVAKRDPDAVLAAIEKNRVRLWANYDSAAATLSILEALGNTNPSRVKALIPTSLNELPDEARAVLAELLIASILACKGSPDEVTPVIANSDQPTKDNKFQEFHLLRAQVVSALLSAATETSVEESPVVFRSDLRDGGPPFFLARPIGLDATGRTRIIVASTCIPNC